MRKQLVTTCSDLLAKDEKFVVLLGDIGVFGFRQSFSAYPDRVYNIGILEQSTIGLAAGLAMSGLIPLVHTIAPFLVERAYEQLKDDFGYQKLGGNFVSVGGSYDYAALGCTHHCPGDVGILMNIPGMEIVVPGTPSEFDLLLKATYNNNHPTYFRLSESQNTVSHPVEFGKAVVVQTGTKGVVIIVGTCLQPVMDACSEKDLTILYYTTIFPFDAETLKAQGQHQKILLVEPYYEGGLLVPIMKAIGESPVQIKMIGVPREFLTHYGTKEEHDAYCGLTSEHIKQVSESFFV